MNTVLSRSIFLGLMRSLLYVLGIFAAVAGSNSQAIAKDHPVGNGMEPRRTGRILVQLREGVAPSDFVKWSGSQPLKTVLRYRNPVGLHVMQPTSGTEDDGIARLQASGLVEYAEPDYILAAFTVPNDPQYKNGAAWGLNKIGAPSAWSRVRSAVNVVVAIIDSGIRASHEDLSGNLWTNPGEIAGNGKDDDDNGIADDVHGFNAINNNGDLTDKAGHGTHVAGIIGAIGNNGKGSAGIAWTVQLMALKFMDALGEGATSDAIACIDYALEHGAHIINASWGGGGASRSLQRAIERARSAGVLFVAAAGNDEVNTDRNPIYPSSYSANNIVSVAASDSNDGMASFSNYGANSVDLMAPGVGIFSAWNLSDTSYATLNGTSMAAPYVTGALALLKARFPDKNYTQLISALLNATDKVGAASGKTRSGGRLNIRAALDRLAPAVPPALSVAGVGTTFEIDLRGEPGGEYSIQQSVDLSTWRTVTTTVADTDGQGKPALPNPLEQYGFFRAVQE